MDAQCINGTYRILYSLGSGGMSEIYLAENTITGEKYAVKIIDREDGNVKELMYLKSITGYMEKLRSLSHPSIVRFKEVIDCGYTIYIVMEYIEGRSLDKVIEQYGAVPEEKVLKWVAELADALNYLHNQDPPVIYRDMKPSNIMLTPSGAVKIIDFEISREEKNGKGDTAILGTRGYAPPEQYSGKTDKRSDIYALGMTMYHLLTGSMPESWESCVSPRIINSLISEGTESIILKATDPDPDKRYQDCNEMLYDLLHPENAGKECRKKLKKKLTLFAVVLILTVITCLSSVTCFIYGSICKSNSYDVLLGRVNSIESYIYASDIYPGRADAYLKILETYEERGKFSAEESNEFLRIYNGKKEYMSRDDSSIAYLNYKAGLMYFNFYSGNSISDKIQKAYPFFRENHENMKYVKRFPEKDISESYYQICAFYKSYILKSSQVKEVSYVVYDNLLSTLMELSEKTYGAGEYDRLVLYNSTIMFVYSERHNLSDAGYEYESLIPFLDHIYGQAEKTKVRKKESVELKKEIFENRSSCYMAVDKAYGRKEQRL